MQVSDAEITALNRVLDHDNLELRAQILEFINQPLYKRQFGQTVDAHRATVNRQLKGVLDQKFASVRDYKRNPLKYFTYLETLMFVDYSLSIKNGVHWTLCGGSIQSLGTEKHFIYFDRMDRGEIVGCFAMTELGHGSNVMGIETTAVYDEQTQEFVINTPNEAAQKTWIGGLALDAHISTVFAQLYVRGVHQGVHALLVRIRDDKGTICEGVRIKDNGPKSCLNGVDNGRAWFDNYRVPREALLDKFCSVSPSGEYSSPIPNPMERFATMIGGLVAGRVSIGAGGIFAARLGLAIAIRYGYHRKQFGASGSGELPIISYLSHQRRLFPSLAVSIALQLYLGSVKDAFVSRNPSDAKKIHLMVSGLKAWGTWNRVDVLHQCRDCCGGHGLSAYNLIGPMLSDFDVDTSFEGDNCVLMQQISKAMVSEATAALKKGDNSVMASVRAPVKGDVRDLNYVLALHAARRKVALQKLLNELAAKRRSGLSSAAAFSASLDLAMDASWSYVQFEVLEAFLQTIRKNPDAARVLTVVYRLFALTLLERNVGFYLQHALFPVGTVDEIRVAVNEMCQDLYQNEAALALVKAFNFPDHVMPSIAFPDYIERLAYRAKL